MKETHSVSVTHINVVAVIAVIINMIIDYRSIVNIILLS